MPADLPAQLRVEVVRSQEQLTELEEAWSRLHQSDPRSSGWTEPHLLVAFERMYFPAHRPQVLVAREPNGTVRGVLPLAVEMRRVGPVYLRQIVPLAGSQTCYPDAVIEPGAESSVMPALVERLRRMHWDELRLRWVEPDAHLLHHDYGLAHGVLELQSEPGDPRWQLDLTERQDLLRGSAQKKMLRNFRRLSESGEIAIGWEPPERTAAATEEFVALHSRLKDHQMQLAFYRRGSARDDTPQWLQQESAAGRADLFTIRCDSRLIAGKIVLRHHGRACGYRTAWEPTLAPLGLGILLMTKAMEACRERGDREFDVGPGVEAYKEKWASRHGHTVTVTATRNTWRSRLADRWLALRSRRER